MKFDKTKWVGRKFKCKKTGEILVLTEQNVHPERFLSFGDCFVDLGDGYYARFGGEFEEIK